LLSIGSWFSYGITIGAESFVEATNDHCQMVAEGIYVHLLPWGIAQQGHSSEPGLGVPLPFVTICGPGHWVPAFGCITSMKTAHIILSLAFAVGCTGLLLIMRTSEMLHRAYPFPDHGPEGAGNIAQGDFELFCIRYTHLLPYFALPAVCYALYVSLCGKASVQSFCLFGSILALVFMTLLVTVAVVSMISWIALYD